MDNPFQVSLHSRRKWRILTSTVHITNNPWTLFSFSACCPERLGKWFGTNLVFKPKSRWQGLLLAGRYSVGILVSPAHGNLEWNPQSIFLLVPILKEVAIVLKKGRRKAVSCEQSGVSEWGFCGWTIYIFLHNHSSWWWSTWCLLCCRLLKLSFPPSNSAKALATWMLSSLNDLPSRKPAETVGKWGLLEVCHLCRYWKGAGLFLENCVPAEGAENLPVWPYAPEVLVVQCFGPGCWLFKAMAENPVPLLHSRYVNSKH